LTQSAGSLKYIKKPGDVAIRIRVPKELVGSLIGKGGELIKVLTKASGTQMKFEDWNGPEVRDGYGWGSGGIYSILTIEGAPAAVIEGVMLVCARLSDIAASHLRMAQLLLPEEITGRVIGKKGENLKRLKGGAEKGKGGGGGSLRVVIGDAIALGTGGTAERVIMVTLCGPADPFRAALTNLIQIVEGECQQAIGKNIQLMAMLQKKHHAC